MYSVRGYGSAMYETYTPVPAAVAPERTLQRGNDIIRATRLANGKFRFQHGAAAFVADIHAYRAFVNDGYVRVA